MSKIEIINQVSEVVEPIFSSMDFVFIHPNIFEKKNNESLYQYVIDVAKSQGGFSLHLILKLLNKNISNGINMIMKKVLTDKDYTYPENWNIKLIEDSIKVRTKIKEICMLTDWRILKDEQQLLEDFNKEFSIWFYSFNCIDEKDNWKEQLIKSASLSNKWFNLVDNEDYLIDNTYYPALYLLKVKDKQKELQLKYESIMSKEKANKKDTKEIELFFKYLNQ
jgi:hypothetical protein